MLLFKKSAGRAQAPVAETAWDEQTDSKKFREALMFCVDKQDKAGMRKLSKGSPALFARHAPEAVDKALGLGHRQKLMAEILKILVESGSAQAVARLNLSAGLLERFADDTVSSREVASGALLVAQQAALRALDEKCERLCEQVRLSREGEGLQAKEIVVAFAGFEPSAEFLERMAGACESEEMAQEALKALNSGQAPAAGWSDPEPPVELLQKAAAFAQKARGRLGARLSPQQRRQKDF